MGMDDEFNWLDLLGQVELTKAAIVTDAVLQAMNGLTENGKTFVLEKIKKTIGLERNTDAK